MLHVLFFQLETGDLKDSCEVLIVLVETIVDIENFEHNLQTSLLIFPLVDIQTREVCSLHTLLL